MYPNIHKMLNEKYRIHNSRSSQPCSEFPYLGYRVTIPLKDATISSPLPSFVPCHIPWYTIPLKDATIPPPPSLVPLYTLPLKYATITSPSHTLFCFAYHNFG